MSNHIKSVTLHHEKYPSDRHYPFSLAIFTQTGQMLFDILRENGKIGHAQFIIATHSPILLAYEDAAIYSFDHSPARVIEYEETDHYQIYKQFILDR